MKAYNSYSLDLDLDRYLIFSANAAEEKWWLFDDWHFWHPAEVWIWISQFSYWYLSERKEEISFSIICLFRWFCYYCEVIQQNWSIHQQDRSNPSALKPFENVCKINTHTEQQRWWKDLALTEWLQFLEPSLSCFTNTCSSWVAPRSEKWVFAVWTSLHWPGPAAPSSWAALCVSPIVMSRVRLSPFHNMFFFLQLLIPVALIPR